MAWNGSDNEKVGRSVPDRRNRNAASNGAGSGLRGYPPRAKAELAKQGATRGATERPPYRRGFVAGLVVVVGGLAAWLIVGNRGEVVPADSGRDGARPSRIAEVAPQIATNAPAERVEAKAAEPEKPQYEMIGNKRGKMVSCETNASGAVISKWVLEDGRVMKNVAPQQVFDNPADQVLAMLLGAEENADIPPIPDLGELDVAFFKATLKPIEIAEDDPPDVKRIKERVIQGREDMLALMRQGKSFADIARDHHELVTGNVQIRTDCIREIKRFEDEGDVEGAVKYRDKVNEALKGMGIDEINMPITEQEIAESEEENE